MGRAPAPAVLGAESGSSAGSGDWGGGWVGERSPMQDWGRRATVYIGGLSNTLGTQ